MSVAHENWHVVRKSIHSQSQLKKDIATVISFLTNSNFASKLIQSPSLSELNASDMNSFVQHLRYKFFRAGSLIPFGNEDCDKYLVIVVAGEIVEVRKTEENGNEKSKGRPSISLAVTSESSRFSCPVPFSQGTTRGTIQMTSEPNCKRKRKGMLVTASTLPEQALTMTNPSTAVSQRQTESEPKVGTSVLRRTRLDLIHCATEISDPLIDELMKVKTTKEQKKEYLSMLNIKDDFPMIVHSSNSVFRNEAILGANTRSQYICTENTEILFLETRRLDEIVQNYLFKNDNQLKLALRTSLLLSEWETDDFVLWSKNRVQVG